MIVSALKQKGNNVIVQFDNGESLILDYRTVLDNGIRKNDSIDESKKEKLVAESNFLKIKDSAFRLITLRQHSISELRTKLNRKKIDKELLEKVISHLIAGGFLDDERFAASYVEERIGKKIGLHKVRAELYKKGVERSIVNAALSHINSEQSYESAAQLAARKLEFLQRKEKDFRKIKAKLYSFLNSRGFETEVIIKVLRDVRLDIDDEIN